MEIKALFPGDPLWETVAGFAENCLWPEGRNLSQRMRDGGFHDWERVLVALDGETIAGFCTLSKTCRLPKAPYCPYVGDVFVDLPYRGNRLSANLIDAAAARAQEAGFDRIFLVSDHSGPYEKYGFQAIDRQTPPWNPLKTATIFVREMEPAPAPVHGMNIRSMATLLFYLLLLIGLWFIVGRIAFPS